MTPICEPNQDITITLVSLSMGFFSLLLINIYQKIPIREGSIEWENCIQAYSGGLL